MMKVDLFIPCFIDQLYPETAFSVMKLLRFCGVDMHYNPEQTCCGQPAFNSGYWKEARSLAIKFLKDFEKADLIVSPSASCTGYIKNYFHRLFADDPVRLEQFQQIRPGIYELTDFLVNVLKITSFGAEFNYQVAYHDACSALREYGIREEPRILLRNVKGLELTEMKDTETCCGFGGTFSIKFTAISTAMTQQKIENALATGAEYIVSTESSCLMNLESYIRKNNIPIKTIHIADILASGW
jgi:L-lactate dehydrogenase complex protein LldE